MSHIQRVIKGTVDRIVAAGVLLAATPFFAFAVILIKCFSRGPVFFIQERIGYREKPFRIFKFRTMHVQQPGDQRGTVTTRSDPRIFFGGNLLRKWKIDELPQLFNVLNGTMSLVGPRPTTANDHERMNSQQRRRSLVKPGITGLAQINGGASISWPRRIEYDLDYIANYSLWRDFLILAKTAWLLVTGRADVAAASEDEWSDSQSESTPTCAPWPVFDREQIEAVTRVLESGKVNYWTGQEGRRFEEEFAEAVGCRHAIALANGTVALELALFALGVGPGDDVVVPSRTFIASASCVCARGARPRFADVDRTTQGISRKTVEAVLTPRTKAVIAVHLAGCPCDMDPIIDLARERGLAVIEDCAQAHGAEYKGRPVGSLGDIGAFSFCQDKIITTGGEGGMLVTNRTELWHRAWQYKDHGKTPDTFLNPQPPSIHFRWIHEETGTNLRMTEMQAAIGRIALRRLPDWLNRRQQHAARLRAICERFPSLRTPDPQHVKHAYYKFYTFVIPDLLKLGWSRDRILEELRAAGIPCFSGSCSEIYLEKAFPVDWRPRHRHEVARALGETSLMFLVHPTLTEADLQRTVAAIDEVMSQATISADRPSRGRHRRAA